MNMMGSYSSMRSHITPIPTPGIVRLAGSLLAGAAVAVPTTDLTRGTQLITAVLCLVIALGLTLMHPYRAEMKAFRTERNISAMPTIGQMLPLFITWLALMIAPILAPLPLWGSALIWFIISAWIYMTYPHIDGSRALAFA